MARVKCPWPSSMTSGTFSEAAMEEMNWRISATWAGLVLYALASIAVMNAAVSDGLIAPTLLKKMVAASAETRDVWQMLMNFNFQMNQAFARVYAVGIIVSGGVVVGGRFAEPDAGARSWDLRRRFGSRHGHRDLFGIFDARSAWVRDVDFRAGDLVFDCCGRNVASAGRLRHHNRRKSLTIARYSS